MSETGQIADAVSGWPDETRDVYQGLQTYRIVGASACVLAIMHALQVLAAHAAVPPNSNVYRELSSAGALFSALKPDTAAYMNAVRWLVTGLEAMTDAGEAAAKVARRVEQFSAHSSRSVARIVTEACRLLPLQGHLLIHDYSSTVLAIVHEAGRQGKNLHIFVTAGAPVNQGSRVAEAVVAAGHQLTYLPDAGIGRVMTEVDIVLSGVETLFRNGDLANTVGTYPIALVAREARVPLYGVTERMKIHPTASGVTAGDLTAQVLHAWPPDEDNLPPNANIRREVLDLTPAALVTGYVTEEGVLSIPEVDGALARLYNELDSLP